jgi:hypothetical protein
MNRKDELSLYFYQREKTIGELMHHCTLVWHVYNVFVSILYILKEPTKLDGGGGHVSLFLAV